MKITTFGFNFISDPVIGWLTNKQDPMLC